MSDTEASAAPSYEQARAELDQIVTTLERGSATLEEALTLWQRGEQLADVCARWLDGAQAQLDATQDDPEDDTDAAGPDTDDDDDD